jgi:predicted outer membrane repeat protein
MGAQSMSKMKRVFGSWRGFLMAVGLVALVAACGQQVQPAAPEVASFTATPATITEGETSLLEWEVTGSATIVISTAADPEVLSTSETTGSLEVEPDATTEYTLTATNPGGSDTASVTVTVVPADAPPTINSFTATPSTIQAGGSSQLAWSVAGAYDSISLSDEDGVIESDLDANGSHDVEPTVTTEYTLTVVPSDGTLPDVTQSVIVTVGPVVDPGGATIEIQSAVVVAGSQVTLEWTVDNADSIEVFAVADDDPTDEEPIAGPLVGSATGATVAIPASDRQTIRVVAHATGGDDQDDWALPTDTIVVSDLDYDPYDSLGFEPEDEIPGTLRYVVANAPVGAIVGFAADIDEIDLHGVDLELNGEGNVDAHLIFRNDLIVSAPESGVTIRGISGYPGDPSDPEAITWRSRVVFVHADATVTLENLTITGGEFIYNGGGIRNDGVLTVVNSVVTGNRSWYRGGGIWNHAGADLTMIDSVVSDNRSVTEDDEVDTIYYIRGEDGEPEAEIEIDNSGYGGGLYNGHAGVAGIVTLTNTTFSSNEAKFSGGAVYIDVNSSVVATGSDVTGNVASYLDYVHDPLDAFSWGGGFAVFGSLDYSGADILSNDSADQGGGLFLEWSATAAFAGAFFDFNTADFGGAIRHRWCDTDDNLSGIDLVDPDSDPAFGSNNVANVDASTNNYSGAGDGPFCPGVDAVGFQALQLQLDAAPRSQGRFYLPTGTEPRNFYR